MRLRPILSLASAATAAGLMAVSLGAGVATAASPYRSAAGLYELHLYWPGHPVDSMAIVLMPNHIAEAPDGPSGIWEQPGNDGTIDLTLESGPYVFFYSGLKMSNGIGSWNKPGVVTLEGTPVSYFWADAESS